jgi:hypothetical protein
MRPWSVASKMRSRRMARFFTTFADNMIERGVGDEHYRKRPLLDYLRTKIEDDGGVILEGFGPLNAAPKGHVSYWSPS